MRANKIDAFGKKEIIYRLASCQKSRTEGDYGYQLIAYPSIQGEQERTKRFLPNCLLGCLSVISSTDTKN